MLQVIRRSTEPKPGEDAEQIDNYWDMVIREVEQEREEKLTEIRRQYRRLKNNKKR